MKQNQCTFYQEPLYKIARKDDGEIVFVISNYSGDPSPNPEIIYDGGEHALMYRDGQTSVLLGYINPAFRAYLSNAKSVLVVELKDIHATEKKDIKIMQTYNANVSKVRALPISTDKIVTPEQAVKSLLKK